MLLSSEAGAGSAVRGLFFPLLTVVPAGIWALFNVAFPSLYGAWFSVAFFILYLLIYVRRDFSFVLLTCFVSYYYFALVLGAVSAESGIYMLEIKQQGQPNGAAALVLFFYFLFMEVMCVSWRLFTALLKGFEFPSLSVQGEKIFGVLLCVTVLFVCVGLVYFYSSPIIMGIERSTFKAAHAPSWFAGVYSIFLQSFSVVALLWCFSRGGRKFYTLLVFFYFVFMFFVFGEKFSGMVLLLFTLMAIWGGQDRKLSLGLLVGLLIFALVLFFLVYYAYFSIGRDPVEFILARYALQGQLIWSVVADPHLGFFKMDDVGCLVGKCFDGYSLIDIVSRRYLPDDVYSAYQAGGNKLSGFSPAAHILAFGIVVSVMLCVFSSVIYGAVLAFWVAAVRSRNLLVSVVAYKLLFSLGYLYLVDAMPVLYGAAFWGALYIFLALLVLALISSRQRLADQPKG